MVARRIREGTTGTVTIRGLDTATITAITATVTGGTGIVGTVTAGGILLLHLEQASLSVVRSRRRPAEPIRTRPQPMSNGAMTAIVHTAPTTIPSSRIMGRARSACRHTIDQAAIGRRSSVPNLNDRRLCGRVIAFHYLFLLQAG